MLQRMDSAKEFRNAAWEGLGKGGWFPSVSGYLFNALVGGLMTVAVFGAIRLFADRFGVSGLVEIDEALAKTDGLLNAITIHKIEDAETLVNVCKWAAVSSLISIFVLYTVAVFKYGMAAMAMAVIRRGAAFTHAISGYGKGWRTVWLMSLAGMYQFFWTMLFIVPGIRAYYSYRMIYFVKIDRPELPAAKIISESKRLMEGRRWKLFCLDVSFWAWYFLSVVITRNLLDAMVRPYHTAACAAFYEDLLNRDEAGAFGAEYGADD